jgi:hypothetical protein
MGKIMQAFSLSTLLKIKIFRQFAYHSFQKNNDRKNNVLFKPTL